MKMTEKQNHFIASTAKDYDMDYEEVKTIYDKFPNTFYAKLEKFIEERAKRDE